MCRCAVSVPSSVCATCAVTGRSARDVTPPTANTTADAPAATLGPVFAAANHDPAVFPDPGRFDPSRDNGAALTFSHDHRDL